MTSEDVIEEFRAAGALREGHFVLQVSAAPGTSLPEMLRIGQQVSDGLLADKRIATVEQQVGRAEQGEDTFGPQSYLRLLPGQALDLRTQAGCVLYENRRDWTETEEGSFALAGDRLDWRQGMVPGLKVTSLHQGLTKHTALVRWAPDTRFNPHTHVGGEEILVLAGVFRDEHGTYPAGTWIRSPHMSHHRPFTESEGATILVKVGHLQVPV